MSRDPDSVALEAASSIVHAVDHMTFPGGDVQLKAHIQCIVYDAIHRANTPDSAAQGAMTDEQSATIAYSHGIWSCGAANHLDKEILGKFARDVIALSRQPSDATAQPITDERAAFIKWAESRTFNFKRSPDGGYYWDDLDSAWQLWQSLANTAQPRVGLTDERIMDVFSKFCGWPSEKYPLTESDVLQFGRALLANTAQGKPDPIAEQAKQSLYIRALAAKKG